MIRKYKGLFPILLLLFDIVTLTLLLILAIFIRIYILPIFLPKLQNAYIDIKNYLWFVGLPIAIFFYEGLYKERFTFWDEVKYIWKSLFISLAITIFLLFALKISENYSRNVIIIWMVFGGIFLPVLRTRFKKVLYAFNIGKNRVLIAGIDKYSISFLKALKQETNLGYEVVGFVDDNVKEDKIEGVKVYKFLKKIDRYIKNANIDVLAIAPSDKAQEEISELVNKVLYRVEKVLYIPDIKEIPLTGLDTMYFFKEDLLALEIKNNLADRFNLLVKRAFDYMLSFTILPVLIPIMIVIALIIKLTSKGPVIFAQERPGKDGKVFKCYKFRTMYENADKLLKDILEKDEKLKEEYMRYRKLKNDPRVTSFGRFLRKTSLDELPQIFNVLKGEMSLVGPRPYLKSEVEEMKSYEKHYILAIRPGITGIWQVSGRNEISFEDRIKLEIWYARNWSLWIDIVILFKTIRVVFKREGAY